MANPTQILEDRELSTRERELVHWLLEHGTAEAKSLLSQLPDAHVCSRCGCGCASIDIAVDSAIVPDGSGMKIVSDYQYRDDNGNLVGVFVFTRQGLLAGLEIWPIDETADTSRLPDVCRLIPLDIAR